MQIEGLVSHNQREAVSQYHTRASFTWTGWRRRSQLQSAALVHDSIRLHRCSAISKSLVVLGSSLNGFGAVPGGATTRNTQRSNLRSSQDKVIQQCARQNQNHLHPSTNSDSKFHRMCDTDAYKDIACLRRSQRRMQDY